MDRIRPFWQISKGRWPPCHVVGLTYNRSVIKWGDSRNPLFLPTGVIFFSFFFTQRPSPGTQAFLPWHASYRQFTPTALLLARSSLVSIFSPVTTLTNVNATEYRPVRGEGLYSAAGLRFGALKKSKSLKQEHDPFNSFHQEFFLLAVYVPTALLCARCAHRRPGRMDPKASSRSLRLMYCIIYPHHVHEAKTWRTFYNCLYMTVHRNGPWQTTETGLCLLSSLG